MDHTKFEDIIAGNPQPITLLELDQFKVYCSSHSLTLQQWIDISITLYKIDRELCYQFLLYVQKHQINRSLFKDYIHQDAKIKIYNSLAAITLNKAAQQSSKQQTEKYMKQTIQYINLSEKIKMIIEKNIIRPYHLYYTGEIMKASTSLNKIYEQSTNGNQKQPSPEIIVVILGLAQNSFIKKNYQKSLQYYKKALQIKKSLPSKARIGMAYCFYYLEKYQLAELAFRRIINIDQKNIQAYIGLAAISDKKDDYNSYFDYLVEAYKINPKHPLVLLHLSEHFLLKGQSEKTIKFCEEGLKEIQKLPKFTKIDQKFRNDYEEFKARFNNILGQVYHIQNKYQRAIKYYLAAKDKGLHYNSIFLSQVYMYPNYQNYVEAEKVLQQLYQNPSQKTLKILGQCHKLMAYLKTKTAGKPNQEKGPNYYYKQALKFNKNDYQLYIQYSNILFQVQKKKALNQLDKAKTILKQRNQQIRPQLYNNCGVLQLQLMQYEKSSQLLQTCINTIEKSSLVSQQDQIKNETLLLTAMFNLGIVYEKLSKFNQALETYEKILQKNKYFVDAYIRLANVLAYIGRVEDAIDKLDCGLTECQASRCRFLRNDKFINMKAHILHKMGSDNRAKESIKLLSKTKDMYTIFYELCIDYQMIMRKQTQAQVLKDFLRPKRQMCIKFCQGDHNSIFSYLVLVVLLLTGKKITKKQGVDYFSLLKDGQQQLPIILYNMGIFFFSYEDHENALVYLNRYKQKTNDTNIDEIIALIYLLDNKYDQCIRIIKKCILRDPKNLKYRFQLVYANEKKSEFVLSNRQRNADEIKNSYRMLQICYQYFCFFYKINVNEYTKGQTNPDIKDKVKTRSVKIKQLCQNQRHYTQSKIQYYDKIRKQVQQKQRQQQQIKKKLQRQQDKVSGARDMLLQELMSDEDEQKQKKKEQQEKKQKILAKMRQMEEKLNEQLRQMQEQRRVQVQEKKSKRIANPKKPRKRIPKPKEQEYDFLDSNEEGQGSEQRSYQQQQSPQAHKHKKHHESGHDRKKLKKKAYSEDEEMNQQQEQQQQQVQEQFLRKKKPSQDNEEENQQSDMLKKYLVQDDEQNP